MEKVAKKIYEQYSEWYWKHQSVYPSRFTTSCTFGFDKVPKKAFPLIEAELKPFIDRIASVKKHKHEWILLGADCSWIWLQCADKDCDAGKGLHQYNKQLPFNMRNFKNYIVPSIKKYPELYTELAKKQVKHFEKTGQYLHLSKFAKAEQRRND